MVVVLVVVVGQTKSTGKCVCASASEHKGQLADSAELVCSLTRSLAVFQNNFVCYSAAFTSASLRRG